jgi:hypothetical protein
VTEEDVIRGQVLLTERDVIWRQVSLTKRDVIWGQVSLTERDVIWGQVSRTQRVSSTKKQQVSLAVLRTFHSEILAGTAFGLRCYAVFLSNSGQMSAQLPYVPSKCLSTHHSPIITPYVFLHKSTLLFQLFLCICATDVQ